ncbi:hypothetical protein SPLC1_S230050 [Arthrospira platensis C1]|nr:hypothetical protein SPLC1_S230050 [Arthrospira platensis C1]
MHKIAILSRCLKTLAPLILKTRASPVSVFPQKITLIARESGFQPLLVHQDTTAPWYRFPQCYHNPDNLVNFLPLFINKNVSNLNNILKIPYI